MMRLIRPTSLITLCTLLVISLFLPQVPNSAEQWLTTLLLASLVALSMLLVPSPNEIADLRANAAALKAKGGKVNLTLCGSQKRLCAEIDTKADTWGEKGQFRILKGY